MFQDKVLVFNVVEFQLGSVVQSDEEYLGEEELNNFAISLHWEHFLLHLLVLDGDEMHFIFVVLETDIVLIQLHTFHLVLEVHLSGWLPT